MVLNVTATEDLRARDLVTLLFNDSNLIYARKTSSNEQPEAIAAREIVKGEALVFDTGRDTVDLRRPGGHFYRRR
jgi:hypothetical protein